MAGRKSSPSPEPLGDDAAFFAALVAVLEPRLRAGDRLCLALSGGLDSVVLLDALHRLTSGELGSGGHYGNGGADDGGADHVGARFAALSLSAIHVQHGLSEHADDWAFHCAALCRERGIPLRIVRLPPFDSKGEGLEAAARRLRYAAFAECNADWLALAHHRDDQAETVLLRLLRGAGVAGAAAMPEERRLYGALRLIRPLLTQSRAALAAYATRRGLSWVEDDSNTDLQLRRNFLRHKILPEIEPLFPGARAALARAAEHFAESAQLLDDLAQADRSHLAPTGGPLPVAGLQTLSPARARNLLRHEMRMAGLRAADARWLDEALRQLATSTPTLCVSTADGDLRVFRGELFVCPRQPPLPARLDWSLDAGAALPWGGAPISMGAAFGEGISRARLAGRELYFAPRAGGERLRPDAKRPRRSVKKLLHEHALPPWQRERLPFLWCGDDLVWVAGLGVDAAYACAPGEPGLVLRWQEWRESGGV
ncbi:tRNA lysidine(34) synthetase TilS [Rhodocyclus tenuis]|uniref:tRNA(Ile)-lysidine synthase n=1 Tax=Rhodocyclus gracilis TaxID=2929842 RepID=A0ABX0WND5_9RHOO|nr:tRNA lysidine(34) synthetase TilS [Rhodocyclus gracilis]NJA89943.1 tRNA lysidine(34) synthetase TilS [Rhodocyclus gracilis]